MENNIVVYDRLMTDDGNRDGTCYDMWYKYKYTTFAVWNHAEMTACYVLVRCTPYMLCTRNTS